MAFATRSAAFLKENVYHRIAFSERKYFQVFSVLKTVYIRLQFYQTAGLEDKFHLHATVMIYFILRDYTQV